MRVVTITAPEAVVSLGEAKQHLRVRHDDNDALIGLYLRAAQKQVDGPEAWLGRAIGVQTLEAHLRSFDELDALPIGPVISVASITYLDADRAEQTADADSYELHDDSLVLAAGASWPAAYTGIGSPRLPVVKVRYKAGFVADPTADPLVAAVPDDIKAAILLMVGDLYANRETAVIGTVAARVPMSTTVENLLASYRTVF